MLKGLGSKGEAPGGKLLLGGEQKCPQGLSRTSGEKGGSGGSRVCVDLAYAHAHRARDVDVCVGHTQGRQKGRGGRGGEATRTRKKQTEDCQKRVGNRIRISSLKTPPHVIFQRL